MKIFIRLFIIIQIVQSSQILNIERGLENENQQQKQIQDDTQEKSIKVDMYQDSKDESNICDLDFTNIFVQGQGEVIPKDGVQVDDTISDLCPGIVVSCCSGKDIEQNFQRVESGIKAFQENLQNLKKVLEFFNTLQEKDVENFFKNYQDKFRQCIIGFNGEENSKDARFRELIVDIQHLSHILEDKYKQYIQKIFISQYKLQCGICDIQNQGNFIHTIHHDREFYNIIVQAPEQIQTYFEIQKHYIELFNLELVGQIVECILDDNSKNKIETLEYGAQPYKRIMKSYHENTVEDDEEALSLFASEGIPGGQIDFNYEIFHQQLDYIFNGVNTDAINQKALTFWVPLENKKGYKTFNKTNVQLSTHSVGYNEKIIQLNPKSNNKSKREQRIYYDDSVIYMLLVYFQLRYLINNFIQLNQKQGTIKCKGF